MGNLKTFASILIQIGVANDVVEVGLKMVRVKSFVNHLI